MYFEPSISTNVHYWKLRYSHHHVSQGRFDLPPVPFTEIFNGRCWAHGWKPTLIEVSLSISSSFTSRKPIVLMLSTNMRPEEGVTIRVAIRAKITLLGITPLLDLPSTCLRALNSSPMNDLSVESLTLAVAPVLAELLQVTCLQGVSIL